MGIPFQLLGISADIDICVMKKDSRQATLSDIFSPESAGRGNTSRLTNESNITGRTIVMT